MAEKKDTMLIDTDVECPNDAIVLRTKLEKTREVHMDLPQVVEEKCIKCGSCVRACRYGALLQKKGEIPFLVEENCVGCNACSYACPADAITHKKKKIGEIQRGKRGKLDIMSGDLVPGYEESSRVVNELLEDVEKEKKEVKIIDCSPGAHCNVIAAMRASDFVILVAEPTLFGYHDFKFVYSLAETLEKKRYIVINKYQKNSLAEKIEAHGEVVCRIPYSRDMAERYAAGDMEPLVENIKPLEELLK